MAQLGSGTADGADLVGGVDGDDLGAVGHDLLDHALGDLDQMAHIADGDVVAHHDLGFLEVHDHGTGVAQVHQLLCQHGVAAQLLEHEEELDALCIGGFDDGLGVGTIALHVHAVGIGQDQALLLQCDDGLDEFGVILAEFFDKHYFTFSMASFRIRMTVSSPLRMGLMRIIRLVMVGSLARKVPETR